MAVTISLISPGAMGAAVGRRLAEHGATVLTSLAGRSAASAERARAAGLRDASPEQLVAADLILSIVPPAEAEPLARRLAPTLAAATAKPVYVDCNALSPATKRAVAAIVAATGTTLIDGAIIGGPPQPGGTGPAFYLSGEGRHEPSAVLAALGLDVHPIEGPIGAAAALKMAYSGINKGNVALGAAMMLAASRAGAAGALHQELGRSLGPQLARLERSVPDMYPKAYRWVAEMREIAAFAGEDEATAMIFEGMARLFERLAADVAGDQRERALLDGFLRG